MPDGQITFDRAQAPRVHNIIYISDVADPKDRPAFLFVRGLPNDSPPRWLNVALRTIVQATPKNPTDVPAKSAHFVISKYPYQNR